MIHLSPDFLTRNQSLDFLTEEFEHHLILGSKIMKDNNGER